ncbi:cyclopentanol dehydrogenase [Sinorhizobium meliloti CCNWSX0020]|uniref:Cyclopentanol dehydrogenase n=1 Tax=Sinorhizobium meliloti CCNWSX0020 TaxID=1107881 RepID=H0G712_RHIML|nr:SDR family NAD(P)-dependent oxidoreductase [Sinorhizobium meliloti]EHK74914.1 cyclopentanol dehydrogenase [Sinorhizobium meliloti CCNWSX0020]
MSDMNGKVALITGSARGQGLAMAQLFAKKGAAVVLCDVLEKEGRTAVEALSADGFEARFFVHDVSSETSWQRLMEDIIAWKGRLDILVNNAGIVKRKNIATYALSDWQDVLNVNLTGAFLGIQAAAKHMQAAGGGAIVNIGSNSAFAGHPDVAYAVSKWGMRGLTRSAAMEFASSRIRVNCVCPGVVVTDINRNAPHLQGLLNLTPLSRAAEPSEVASVVCFLASEDAAMVTGEEILVDGGFTNGGSYWRTGTDAGFYGSR